MNRPELPDAHRFIDLSHGEVHYRTDGAEDGPIVVLIHGATVPAWEFELITPYLVDAGLRTLAVDLYGHGYSDRPHARYTHDLFAEQLIELLDALGIAEPVDLFGHSLGAAVSARLAIRQPQRVRRIVLAAPLVDFTANLAVSRLLRVPAIGEFVTAGYVVPMLARRRTRRYRGIDGDRFVGRFETQLIKPGFDRALLSMLRHGALGDQRPSYEALARTRHAVLLLRGARDDILPRDQFDAACRLLPEAMLQEIPDAPHSFILSHPDQVAPVITGFLRPVEYSVNS